MPSPRTLGKYHVLERLAATPLAEVFKVKTVGIAGFEKVQVLSRVTPGYSQDPAFARAFVEEAKIAFSLNHRNIVQVFEFGKVDGELFLATEYIPGVNLREVARVCRDREMTLPVGLACYLMGEVAAGLEYAHRKTDQWGQALGVVHCDLSPLNVACSFEGSVKILDFGSARAAYQTVPYLERHLELPHYLSPEQISGDHIDALSDIFSFGAILWELLTGTPLFGGDTVAEVHEAILDGPMPPPRTFNHEVPDSLDDVTMRCLERDPARRFTSANDLQLELHRIQRDVGAVIGSRALSTFLGELLPDYPETRDVRQESSPTSEDKLATRRRDEGARLRRGSSLIDAAAELAERPNPPARRVSSETAQRTERRRGDSGPRNRLNEARGAGVLRSSRVDEDVSLAQRPPALAAQTPALSPGPGLLRDAQRSGVPDDYDDELEHIPSDQVTARPQLKPRETSQQRRRRRSGRRYAERAASWRDESGDPRHQATEVSVNAPAEELRRGHWDPEQQAEIDTADGPVQDLRATAESGEPERIARSPQALRATADSLQRTSDSLAPPLGDSAPEFSPPPHMVPTATGEEDEPPTPRPPLRQPASLRIGGDSLHDDELDDFDALDVVEEIDLLDEGTVDDSGIHVPTTERAERSAKLTPQADEAPTPALGERKRCVVVAARLDCAAALRDEAERLTADIAYKLEGQLHHSDADGLVVLFGLPVGHENDIVSAVRFAFDAEEAVRHLGVESTASGVRGGEVGNAGLRCGIRAGTARLSGQPAKEGYLVLGNSVREARALAEHAEEGHTVIAGAAARLAATHYQLREIEAIRRQGKPIRCHRVVAPHSGERDRRLDSSDPLIGREIETKAMRTVWREAVMRSEQRSLLIVGEPGIGKSRLVDEFILRYCGEAAVVAAAASPHRVETPYSLIASVLRGITGVWSSGSSRGRARLLDRLRSMLDEGHDAEQALDALAAVIDPGTSPVGETGSGFAKSRVYRALRQVLHRAGDQRPIVLVVEDLHWADSASIECLRALVSRPEDTGGALLVLATARPDEGSGDGHSLLEDAGVSSVLLEELDEPARQRLIVNLLGEHGVGEVLAGVEQRAGGNPFFIRELCDAIKELGGRVAGIPETVQGVILSRIDRLPTQVKAVLQYATVIGPTFREGILTRLLSRNPARSLAELRNRGVLVPSVDMAVPFTSTAGASDQFERQWSFRHVLVQELIYQGINMVDRRSLHRRIGEIMARRAERGSTDPPAEVGRHLELGGLTEQAAGYYVRAAHKAAAAYANIEAVELYGRALRLCGEQDDIEYEAHAGRERVYGRLGLHDEQAADLRTLGKLSGNDAKRRADLRAREAVHLLRLGQLYRALEAAEQAEAASEEAGDRLLMGEALRLRGEAYGRLNDHARAEHAVTSALEIFEAEGAVQHQVRARIALGRVHLVQANYDEAFRHYDPALELIKQTGDRWQERVLRNNLAVVHYCRGDFSRALDEAHYSLELCRQYADRAREGDNASVVGIVSLEMGLYEQARGYIDDALAIHRETGSAWSEADTLVYAGLLDAFGGDTDRGLSQLEEAKSIAEEMGAKYIAVNARNAIALVLCDRNEPGDAAKAVDEATEAFESAGQAQLIVGEIPGLSRAARATALLGDLDAARALSRRAVELLEAQKAIESSEEEIYYTHYRILDARGDDGREYLERAHSGFVGKMALIDEPDARAAYSDRVRLNAAIRRDYVDSLPESSS